MTLFYQHSDAEMIMPCHLQMLLYQPVLFSGKSLPGFHVFFALQIDTRFDHPGAAVRLVKGSQSGQGG